MSAAHWQSELDRIASRGSTAQRPGGLAGLAAARREHHGQFFTPPALADYLWRYVEAVQFVDYRDRPTDPGVISLFDSSCGTGRLFRNACPERHTLYGCDIDADAISALSAAANAAGFNSTFLNAGMERIRLPQATFGLLNPPFGINLQSPFLIPAEGVTAYGRYGANTSALSQAYALLQAISACEVSFAILPDSFAGALHGLPRIAPHVHAIIRLPPGLFRAESTEVRVCLVVMTRLEADPGYAPLVAEVSDLSGPLVDLDLRMTVSWRSKPPKLCELDTGQPAITIPVTGDRTVRMVRSGRRVELKFACGLVQAKVLNSLLRERIVQERGAPRLPKGVVHTGQGALELESLLFVDRIGSGLATLQAAIRTAGGDPKLCDSLAGYYRRRIRSEALRRTPLRRWANVDGAPDLTSLEVGRTFDAIATTSHALDPSVWGGAVFRKGATYSVQALVDDAGLRTYRVTAVADETRDYSLEEFCRRFRAELAPEKGWRLVHAGRRDAFPELARQRATQAERLGLHPLLAWDDSGEACYQFEDVVELSMSPRGVLGWDMALGKGRAAIALALMGGRRNLIVVEAHLVPELIEEIGKMGLPRDAWQAIETPSQLADLRRINIISYARLRRRVAASKRDTYARRLRRRLHTVVADEADLLANDASQQSRALWMLSPKRRYALSGTAIGNYCRNALPLLHWAAGDGTAHQMYGEHAPYVQASNVKSMEYARRGAEVFRERHVTLEWAVREFEDDLKTGAKREVPRLKNVEAFRDWLAPHLLRRVLGEPEIERWVRVPVPTRNVHTIEWDTDHLRKYLRTAWEFSRWYEQHLREAREGKRNVNLISLLAKISEVMLASNAPTMLKMPGCAHGATTAKQRWCMEMLRKFHGEGRKTIIFGTNPEPLRRMAELLEHEGIRSVLYTGGTGIKKRTEQLNREFRHGDASAAFITFGAGRTGLNLPQGSRIILYNRAWAPKIEEQAIRRAVRPQQTEQVECHYGHLRGGIDEYMAQLVGMKRDAIDAGVDFGDQEIASSELIHLDTILLRFCKELCSNFGLASNDDLMEFLSHAA